LLNLRVDGVLASKGEKIMDKEKSQNSSWVETIVGLFKMILEFNYHGYGTKKKF
jgi:hypothetical protein